MAASVSGCHIEIVVVMVMVAALIIADFGVGVIDAQEILMPAQPFDQEYLERQALSMGLELIDDFNNDVYVTSRRLAYQGNMYGHV